MLRNLKLWTVPCCLLALCIWTVGCGGGAATTDSTDSTDSAADMTPDLGDPADAPEAGSTEAPEGEGEAPAAEGEGETADAPPAEEGSADAGGGSTINFGDL